MKYFQTIEMHEAIVRMQHKAKDKTPAVETVGLSDALNRVLSEDIAAPYPLPQFRRSTVDGYAVRAKDIAGASANVPAMLNVAGEVHMGEAATQQLGPNDAIYVPTGGMVPDGADTMVMIEETKTMGDRLLVYKSQGPHMHLIFPGDDVQEGEVLLHQGQVITPGVIGVLASFSIDAIPVFAKPSCLILSTGDEIVGPGEDMPLGKVRDINTYTIEALVTQWGMQVQGKALLKDDKALFEKTVQEAMGTVDFIFVSGGSSVGVRDFTQDVIQQCTGELLFHGVNLKPGKPTLAGYAQGTWIIGLPGHPVSAMHVLYELIKPYVEQWWNQSDNPVRIPAVLTENIASSPGKRTIQPVHLMEEEGQYKATPHYSASSMISQFVRADGVIIIPKEVEGLYAGDLVQVELRQ